MEAYICRWSFTYNLDYAVLIVMSLDGAVVSFYRVTLWLIMLGQVLDLELCVLIRFWKLTFFASFVKYYYKTSC